MTTFKKNQKKKLKNKENCVKYFILSYHEAQAKNKGRIGHEGEREKLGHSKCSTRSN